MNEIKNNNSQDNETKKEEPLNDNYKINLTDCSKEQLMKLGVFTEPKAMKFVEDRNLGKIYYDIDSLAKEFEIQPHEILEIENHLIFPLKKSIKKGRTIDY